MAILLIRGVQIMLRDTQIFRLNTSGVPRKKFKPPKKDNIFENNKKFCLNKVMKVDFFWHFLGNIFKLFKNLREKI